MYLYIDDSAIQILTCFSHIKHGVKPLILRVHPIVNHIKRLFPLLFLVFWLPPDSQQPPPPSMSALDNSKHPSWNLQILGVTCVHVFYK